MITPKTLRKGDTVGLVATARKISRDELQPAIEILESWGLKVELAPNLFKSHHQFAGTDEQRLADLQGFIDSIDIDAIICVRGGYGTVRIIDELNFFPLIEKPKWICGYSDITVLLNKLRKVGVECLHSTMPVNFTSNTPESLESLRKALFGEELVISCAAHPLNRNGQAKGRVTGGNLSVLYSQTGSGTAIQPEGDILFIEDLDEYLYHIDRMMQNLKRNGYFEGIAGLIVGGMNAMNDNKIPFGQSAEEIIATVVRPYNFPVCFGFPAGHIDDNRSLIFGRRASLKVGDSVELVFENG
ncbi:MAG: LD-carboxypeptidase [Owenweeksia sp.]|nr:LD-carboxypeptidase [Owenweeksia sp.]MBF99413.1 LD-carboxypeptidase [Owenweeksia sp.]HBF21795.1 LD-carboxypeptidase [Cryomorphaceae bacterium]HCQ15147.1 LD-carboxypeptidase [Cryomorphaceae bacterium]